MSNHTLRWMLDEAKACGLQVEPDRERIIFGLPPLGTMSKPSSATAELYFAPLEPGPIHHSLCGPWWLLEPLPHRYYIMDTDEEKWRFAFGASRRLPTAAIVHPTVVERIHNPATAYTPPNLLLSNLYPHPGSQPGTTADLRGFFQYIPPAPATPIPQRTSPATALKLLAGVALLLSTAATALLRSRSS